MRRIKKQNESMLSRLTVTVGLAVGALAAPVVAQDDADVAISDITMYRSGVAHYVLTGLVEGSEAISLKFKTDDVNDILKSMYLLDLDGGRIEAVSYASREPLSKRLSSFAIDISDNPSMMELLARLRGAPIRVETVDGVFEGTILGVEERTTPVPQSEGTMRAEFVNLLTNRGARGVMIDRIASFEILDDQLAQELRLALEALARNRTDNVKGVDLKFDGIGARRVVVGYVREAPVWKTSYRLILPEEGSDAVMQGWAIVENTTDEDWEDVRLSLVAGQPIGFTMDLYEPLFVTRPDVPVPVMQGVGPRVFAGAEFDRSDRQASTQSRARRGTLAAEPMMDAMEMEAAPALSPGRAAGGLAGWDVDADDMTKYAAASQAAANQIGEVFQYTLETPVTIERQKSAMLPILTGGVEAERVSIYGPQDNQYPMRGVRMTNSSGLQLMPGPISVYDGTAFAGDAQIGHVSEDDERLLAYAVDLDVLGSRETRTSSRVERVKIVDGVMIRTVRQEQKTMFRFVNKDADDRVVIVEQPRYSGWDVDPSIGADPYEETSAAHRYRVEVGGGEEAEITHAIARVDNQEMRLLGADIGELLRFRAKEFSPAVRDALTEIAALQQRVRDAERVINTLDEERSAISSDQDRIRRNMGGIDRNSDLYRRYVTKLNEQETRLEQLVGEREQAMSAYDARQADLREAIRTLNVG